MNFYILDENSLHVATIIGNESDALDYAAACYPSEDGFKINTKGPHCVNADFDINPEAEVVNV